MAAHYDSYDYPAYWNKREYEHQSELIAISALLAKIKSIDKIAEIGAGYGRLVPAYEYRAKKVILVEPSGKLLKQARQKLRNSKFRFVQSKIETLGQKVKGKSVDLALLVRVLHHVKNPDECFNAINKLLSDGGYFILEFANKNHFKASFQQLLKGNLTFPLDIFPKDIRSKKNVKKGTIAFVNYHPDIVIEKLQNAGFEVLEKRSVSNIRSGRLKAHLPLDFLLSIERVIQKILGHLNFGPSIFVLARKKQTA